ncbi:Phosphatidylglycerophosphatase and protein-tyrosine phosphatase 1 [Bulinus truncatus]|nr:Phosphatidylglycerophosphatase and protein-tyrosine phosphatase 1 [Bulinus truncatus]
MKFRNWYDRIDETVILGALPLKFITHQLITEENIKGIISLNEDYELKYLTYSTEELNALGLKHLKLSTVDFTGTPSQENLRLGVQFLNTHRELGQTVYVHCKAGRTRSTTLVVCYLMQLHKWKPQEAVEFVRSKRHHILLRNKQLKSIEEFSNSLMDS